MALTGKNILVTGGLGFIGSHTAVELVNAGAAVLIIDNLSNSDIGVLNQIKRLVCDASKVSFGRCDIRDAHALREILDGHKTFDTVVHFAGYKAVGESVQEPLMYYDNNFAGTVTLLKELQRANPNGMDVVFSSSCTVYGVPDQLPLTEDSPLKPVSPYGRTKHFQELMFRDLCSANAGWQVLLLRYFNPVGAHPSGELGEQPVGVPNNLMPYVQQVSLGQRPFLRVYGSDYDTNDGTPVRDYVHVVDIARGHVAAVRKLLGSTGCGCRAINLGTGRGTTVLEMVRAYETASGTRVPYQLVPRRPGDSTAVYADVSLSEKELGWTAEFGLRDMCEHQFVFAAKRSEHAMRSAEDQVIDPV